MRLNDHISNIQPPAPSDSQNLLSNLLDVVTLSLSVDIKKPNGHHNDPYLKFFQYYYVKPDNNGSLLNIKIEEKLSHIEAHILDFFCSENTQTTPYLFIDYAGRGKTTILKYLAFYLYQKEEAIKEKIYPIYISLRTHETYISEFNKTSALHEFFRKLIKESSFNTIYSYFLGSPVESLKFINKVYHSSWQGTLFDQKIEEISENPEIFFASLAQEPSEKYYEFYFGLLSYYSQKVRPIVLLLDDADNFSIDVQRAILDFVKYSISIGLKSLVALRVSTWKTLESDRRDYEPYKSNKINWSLDSIKELLTRRLQNGKDVVLLRSESKHMQVTPEDIVNAFINLLENEQTSDFLIKTSNYNLHSLMRKLSLIPNSWHFSDRYLLSRILHFYTQEGRKQGVPLWTAFNLVFGSYRGTFQSNDDVARCGLINCFCTRDQKHEPYTFFVRSHILVRLKDATNEGTSVRIKEVFDDYKLIFSENLNFTKVFHWTLYRLVQSGLLITKSCRRYQSPVEVNEHIESDSVYISDTGLYYLNWLIFRIDYLSFMKDDIDWPFEVDISTIEPVRVGIARFKKHKQTFRALYELMKIELKMLEEIQTQLKNPGDGKIVRLYVSKFSAFEISKGRNIILFTKLMYDEYLEYLRWSANNEEYLEESAEERNNIVNLLIEYKNIYSAFEL